MPGKNSKFNGKEKSLIDRLVFQNMHIFVGLVIFTVEVVGMTRCYYFFANRRHNLDCYLLTIFWVFCDIQIYKGLFKAAHSDPGYLLPNE